MGRKCSTSVGFFHTKQRGTPTLFFIKRGNRLDLRCVGRRNEPHATTKSTKGSPIGATQIEECLLARETFLPFHVVRIAVSKTQLKFDLCPAFLPSHDYVIMTFLWREGALFSNKRGTTARKDKQPT